MKYLTKDPGYLGGEGGSEYLSYDDRLGKAVSSAWNDAGVISSIIFEALNEFVFYLN